MPSRILRRKTHMPDCESRTQRKYSSDMAMDSTRLPNLCFEGHGARIAHGKARSVQKIHFQMEEGFQQI